MKKEIYGFDNKCVYSRYTNFFERGQRVKEGEMNFAIELSAENWKFLGGNKVDEKVVVPASAYVKLTWTVFKSLRKETEVPVVFEEVQIHKHQVEIPENEALVLVVMLQKGSGVFEVSNNEILLCSGILRETETPADERIKVVNIADKDHQELCESDVYTELQMRGLQYSGAFRNIRKASASGSNGTLTWKDEWITLLEGMIQMFILGNDVRNIQVPIMIRKIVIDLKKHEDVTNKSIGEEII